MEKRGQAEVLQITLLFEFIAGILIAGILMYAVMSMNETSAISQEYLRTDYNILKGVLEGKPGHSPLTALGTNTHQEHSQQKTTNSKKLMG